MAGGVPNAKVDEVPKRIKEMARGLRFGQKVDELSWRRLMKDIEALEAVPEFYGASLLNKAVLWSFKDSVSNINRLFNVYAAKLGKTWDWHLVRATMAPRFGVVDGVKDMLRFGVPESNSVVLAEVLEVCSQTGFFVSADKVLKRLYQIDSELARQADEGHYRFVSAGCQYLESHGVDEVDVASRVVHASRVLLDFGFELRKYGVVANQFGIMFELSVDADIDTLVELNLRISDELSERFEDTLSQHLSIGVYPWEDSLHVGAA